MTDKQTKTIESKATKKVKSINYDLIAKVFNVLNKNSANGHGNAKTKGEVSGGGRKPWKQKGTGNARAGSSRSPIWRGGGVTFGPRSIQVRPSKINKSENKSAIREIIEYKRQNKLLHNVMLDFSKPKTAQAIKILNDLQIDSKVLIITEKITPEIELSFSNIVYADTKNLKSLNLADLVKYKNIVFEDKAWKIFKERYNA